MTVKNYISILAFLFILLMSCNNDKQKITSTNKENKIDSVHKDSIVLKESLKEEDFVDNEYLTEKLKQSGKILSESIL